MEQRIPSRRCRWRGRFGKDTFDRLVAEAPAEADVADGRDFAQMQACMFLLELGYRCADLRWNAEAGRRRVRRKQAAHAMTREPLQLAVQRSCNGANFRGALARWHAKEQDGPHLLIQPLLR